MPVSESSAGERLLLEARQSVDGQLGALGDRLRRDIGGRTGEALAYALGTAGQRVRPALLVGAFRAAGGNAPGIGRLAAAVEVIHTYSLVHDDLPCMDDAPERRGRPTTHVVYDVDTASWVGYLLVP